MSAAHDAAAVYKVKTISFLRREVPIVMQNENGPCPLLALANVLLLRNQIYLPPNTPEVTQDRLVSLVAGYLLDANNEERLASYGEEYKANLQQNIADAIALLPKLATGLDVNIRFQDIRGFEFTQDVAIFDLLDVRLVHGWLVDPQDGPTAIAVGDHSYNELVSILVDALGVETPTHLLTPTAVALHSRDSSFSRRPSKPLAPAPGPSQPASTSAPSAEPHTEPAEAATQQTPLTSQLQGLRLDEEDSSELQQALALSMADSGDGNTTPAAPLPVEQAELGAASSSVNVPPLIEGSSTGPQPEGPSSRAEGDWVNVHKSDAGAEAGMLAATDAAASSSGATENQPVASSSGTHSAVGAEPAVAVERIEEPGPEYDEDQLAKGKMVAFVDVDPERYRQEQGEAESLPTAVQAASASADGGASERRARAQTIQDFLETTSSQLTEHGLISLHQGLRPNELAILFRNNHFNAIFCHANAIWILVTDQGYLFEKDVVWERLCDVNGNTEFARADFSRFSGQPASRDVTVAADLAQAAFASVVPPKGLPDPNAVADADADMALAMQLQQEEENRQRQFLAQQQQQQQASAGRRQGSAQPSQQGARPKSGQKKGPKSKDEKCSIM